MPNFDAIALGDSAAGIDIPDGIAQTMWLPILHTLTADNIVTRQNFFEYGCVDYCRTKQTGITTPLSQQYQRETAQTAANFATSYGYTEKV